MCDVVLASSQLEKDLAQPDGDRALIRASVAVHLYHLVKSGWVTICSSSTMSLRRVVVIVVSRHRHYRLAGAGASQRPPVWCFRNLSRTSAAGARAISESGT
jgi:hypothetical protein